MFHCCWSSARYISFSSVESSKIVVVLPSAATDKVLYAHRNKRYRPTSYHSVIRFQRWSSPALHSIHCTRHPRTCSFVDLVCKPHITSISAIACPTCTRGGPSESTEPLMTYTAGRRQLRCSEYRETVWVLGWQWVKIMYNTKTKSFAPNSQQFLQKRHFANKL